MGEKEDKEKAEKLAAAKKRVAQLQKKKKAASSTAGEPAGTAGKVKGKGKKDKDKDKQEDAAEDPTDTKDDIDDRQDQDAEEDDNEDKGKAKAVSGEAGQPDVQSKEEIHMGEGDADADEAEFNDAIKAVTESSSGAQDTDQFPETESPPISSRKHSGRQQSISQQSKARSTSFRQGTDPNRPMSPGTVEGSDESSYRKQTLRIEELEKENKRLAKEAGDSEARWRKSEEELEKLHEKAAKETDKDSSQDGEGEIAKLREEIASLRRSSKTNASAASKATAGDNSDGLKKELESKESTISDLQLEISRLRGQLSDRDGSNETHDEQVSALQMKLDRAEANVKKLEDEVADAKKALSRASEKAVQEGTEKTSKDIKMKNLERQAEELIAEKDELNKKIEGLEKKIEAMNKLHRETEQRSASKLSAAESLAREAPKLEAKISALTEENQKLREAKKKSNMTGEGDDDALDELEDEARQKLEKRIRELEGEVFELRSGVWRDRRKEIQPDGDGDDFDDVDLSGSGALSSRRRSTTSQAHQQQTRQHSGFAQVLNSGIAAFTSNANNTNNNTNNSHYPASSGTRPRNDSLLQDFDDDMVFDETAFAQAQREEEMKKMVEHVREVKRGLKNWVGWRLNLVDSRRGAGGIGVGEVFDL